MPSAPARGARPWQTPVVIVASGCLIAIFTFGPRATMGLLLPPMSRDMGWTRDIFALAIAIQHIVWGVAQPFGGAVADRFGTVRALCAGGILYATGLAVMANATSPGVLYLAGTLVGFGLAGASLNIVVAAFGKLLPERWRPLATGIGGGASSFGQFLFSPLCVYLLEVSDWRTTLLVYAALVLLVLPLSLALTTAGQIEEQGKAPLRTAAMRQVFRIAVFYPPYLLLIAGYFVTGFHVAFINMHLPAYVQDEGLDRPSAGWVIATIGLCNIFGSITVGWLCGNYPNRYVLSAIYLLRAVSIAAFVLIPISPTSALLFAIATGLLWSSAITPVAGLVTVMFGTQNLAALFGLAHFFHQIGAFLGVWIGGLVFEWTGSYIGVWWVLVAATLVTSLLTSMVKEQPRELQSEQATP